MANGVAAATATVPTVFRNWRRLTPSKIFFIMREGFTPFRAWPAMELQVYLRFQADEAIRTLVLRTATGERPSAGPGTGALRRTHVELSQLPSPSRRMRG